KSTLTSAFVTGSSGSGGLWRVALLGPNRDLQCSRARRDEQRRRSEFRVILTSHGSALGGDPARLPGPQEPRVPERRRGKPDTAPGAGGGRGVLPRAGGRRGRVLGRLDVPPRGGPGESG